MTNTSDFLTQIFIEHMGSASIVPFVSSLTLEAMELFGGYDLQRAAFAGLAGLVAGCILNWIAGFLLALLRQKTTFLGKDSLASAEKFFRKYGFIAAGFFWLPLGSILVLIAGFFKAPLHKVIIAVAIGAAFHLKDYFL